MGQEIVYLMSQHPLVGVWQGDDEDARAEYTVTAKGDGFEVSAIDAVDGEVFEISNIDWSGDHLRFDSLMPSTGRVGHIVFELLSKDIVEVEFTFTDKSIWKRKE